MGLPVVGLVQRLDGWDVVDLAMFTIIVLCSILALVHGSALQRWVAGAFVLLALTMGDLVWGRWHDFGRPLLPLCLLGLSLAGTSSNSTVGERPADELEVSALPLSRH